jgi:alpha-tubulin suppressor-like RCC1 family protein
LNEDGVLFTWETRREVSAPTDAPIPELGCGRFVHDFGVPYRVFALDGVRITSVAAGFEFTVAVTEAGAVYSFGYSDGRLGIGNGDGVECVFPPKRIEALEGIHVVTVAAGDCHALALTRCGKVYSWGTSEHVWWELGHGNDSHEGADDNDSDTLDDWNPHVITALLGKRVQAIAAGPKSSCAVTEDGALYTWVDNTHGSLGHGDMRYQDRPTLVTALQGIRVVGVSVDTKHTLALAADGSLYAFGKRPGLGISRAGEGEQVAHPMLIPQRIPNLTCMVPR